MTHPSELPAPADAALVADGDVRRALDAALADFGGAADYRTATDKATLCRDALAALYPADPDLANAAADVVDLAAIAAGGSLPDKPADVLAAIDTAMAARFPLADRVSIAGTWTPPDRAWLVHHWLPLGTVTLLHGRGGVGKSRLALQLAAALAGGESAWLPGLGAPTLTLPDGAPAPAIVATWEDDADELERRRRGLYAAGAPYADRDALADRLLFADLADAGPLWTVDRHGPLDSADAAPLDALERLAANVGARLVVIDPAYAAFGGSEIDRAHVGAFLTRLRRMAADLAAAVLVVAHPPKGPAGADRAAVSADPSGVSTWRDGVRAVWRMASVTLDAKTGRPPEGKLPPEQLRTALTLTLDKANYGALPDEPLYVRCDWRYGWRWETYDAPAEVRRGSGPDKAGYRAANGGAEDYGGAL